jgi:hypothetical protein
MNMKPPHSAEGSEWLADGPVALRGQISRPVVPQDYLHVQIPKILGRLNRKPLRRAAVVLLVK